MEKINRERFNLMQPGYPDIEDETSGFYYDIANGLLELCELKHLLPTFAQALRERVALVAVGYYQDVIADSGVWHGFVDECRRLYGKGLPFYPLGEEYVDYELNPEDVQFIVWYAVAMYDESNRFISPYNKELMQCAREWYEYLEERYEDAPVPESYTHWREAEVHDKEDAEIVMRLGRWLAHHCYLTTPVNTVLFSEILSEPGMQDEKNLPELQKRVEEAIMMNPDGPLALFVKEWLYLTVEHRLPPKSRKERQQEEEAKKAEHPFYTKFMAASGGERMKIFGDYQSMNEFLISAMGWEPGSDHLGQLKNSKDFVLLVNPERGMLVARNVARCIASPDNALYDKEYARKNAFDLLSVRGRCPADLSKYLCERGMLPDAAFPESQNDEGRRLVADNWDFIARVYLQLYYRD